MKIGVRILLILVLSIAPFILSKGEEMRPYYHSFNSAPRSAFTFRPTQVIMPVPKAKPSNRGVKAVYDSSDFYVWDSIVADWVIKSKIFYKAYDTNKNLLSIIGRVLNNGVWEDSYKQVYTYDSKNNVTSKLYFTWQGGNWVKFKKEIFEYNGHNDLTCYIVTQLSGSNWVNITKNTFLFDNHFNKLKETYQDGSSNGTGWVNNYQYVYEYDANDNRLNETYDLGNDSSWKSVAKWNYVYDNNHNRLSEHYLNWDFANSTFVNSAMFMYQYDSNDNMTQQISQNWENEAWLNSVKTTNTFSESNYKILELVERWNDDGTAWENRLKTVLGYDKKNNKITSVIQEFLNDQWTNVSNFKYTYDAGKHVIESVEQEWKSNTWNNVQKLIYTYNSNGDQTLELNQRWNPTKKWFNAYYITNAFDYNFVKSDESHKSWNIVTDKENTNNYPPFITGDSTHYYIHSIATNLAEVSEPTELDVLIYPNPSNGIFKVALDGQQEIQNLEIYDCTGKLILKQQSNQVEIPGSVPGIYYLKLQQNSNQYSKRIVVQ